MNKTKLYGLLKHKDGSVKVHEYFAKEGAWSKEPVNLEDSNYTQEELDDIFNDCEDFNIENAI